MIKGDASFGGISFGGSSVAENAFYINGLNVTDFYNRNGFSEAPFDFYQEFQVKTGGYSVEFGRTTGGVVNAVAKSGSNEFHYGAKVIWEPRSLQTEAGDHYFDSERYLTSSRDDYSSTKLDLYASGPLIKDRLFFYALYEGRDYQPTNTDNKGEVITNNKSTTGFYGATLDWQISDNNLLSLLAFSNKNSNTGQVYPYDFDSDSKGDKTNEIYADTGGRNWALTWTSYLTDNFSMKLMYGENNREAFTRSLSDIECNFVSVRSSAPQPSVPAGCTTSSTVIAREDQRKQWRGDFEWNLGDHLLRFGIDHEANTSNYDRHYVGPGAIYYNVYAGDPGDTISNGGVIPVGYNGYVRARRYEIAGQFETDNDAYYIEDNWSITDNLVLNLGLRHESFDNKDSEGNSYIKIDNMIAPRVGFSWDMKGDGSSKLFGNLGRYFLPVANVINIKQAGGLLDERTYYALDGYDIQDFNGFTYALPRLGPQIGPVDNSQGDGTVGDLRSEVDRDIDPVYQDEAILGYQAAITDTWSWGVRGIYRRLHNAIDDILISATPNCGPDGYLGYVMANPGKELTVWGDTDCDGTNDGYLTIDTSKEGYALYDSNGNYLGQRGYVTPKRTYRALEFQLDRAWDDHWSFNATYTLAWSEGNAEGPVNSDTNFDDTGRTENFDTPWVNLNGYGPLANDRRHQVKLRGTYAFNDSWQVAGTLDARSGGPITGFGVGNPFDDDVYHSYYICVSNCESDDSTQRVYELSPRGGRGRLPWTFDVGASVTYLHSFQRAQFRAKFSVYNLLDMQREIRVDQQLEDSIGHINPEFGIGRGYQSPRYAQLTLSLDF